METNQAFHRARWELAHRKRRIIFNNDGDDVLGVKPGEPLESFLDLRTTALAGSQVDAIFYYTGSFDLHSNYFNVPGAPVCPGKSVPASAGKDTLHLMSDFARQHGMEVFWSMRVNDTHDGSYDWWGKGSFSPWKKEHMDCLLAERGAKLPVGVWSGLDYEREEVREKVFSIIKDVCDHYDIDGIELDFLRHPVFFKPHALGEQLPDKHRTIMTAFMRSIRNMTEKAGQERGKPLLISIRVNDSVEYCREIGIELDKWLSEGLFDIMSATCYFRLNPWDYIIQLGHRYGIPVYPCLSNATVPDDTQRSSLASYRARALQAWQAGADGIYLFNLFDPQLPHWRELGDPEKLQRLDKLYFLTWRNRDPDGWLGNGRRFQNIQTLTPDRPIFFSAGKPVVLDLTVCDKALSAKNQKRKPTISCRVDINGIDRPDEAAVTLNGAALENGVLTGSQLEYEVPPLLMRCGINCFEIAVSQGAKGVLFQDLAKDHPPVISGNLDWPAQWQVFGPLCKDDPILPEEALRTIPSEIEAGGRRLKPLTLDTPENRFDFSTLFGGNQIGRTVYVFLPFYAAEEMTATLGMGADWWLQAWLDGKMILTTTDHQGNGTSPYWLTNHVVSVELARGKHTVAVRFISGSGSSLLTLGGPNEIRREETVHPVQFHHYLVPAAAILRDISVELKYP